ncbi:MAG: acyl-ACP--UDP-N-acetylglucosamine O-acyltransferase [Polyangiales bacterium]
MIHPTAIVDRRAELDSDVEVGPYCVVGPGVSIARGAKLLSHAVIEGPTHLGARVVVHPFAVVGGAPQDRTHRGEPTRLEIGEDTVIRESVTIHRGTVKDRGLTTVGSRVLLMGAVHVAHDVTIEDDCTVANGCLLAGHAHLEAAVTLGGNVALAPFVRIGTIAFVAAGARVEQDVPPFHVAQGDRASVRALNVVGLERRGIEERSRKALEAAHRAIYRSESPISVAVNTFETEDPWVRRLLEFVRTRTTVPGPSRRGYPPNP